MGATYTRQSTYADGDTITSDHTNDEFDQLLAAFAASTGHTHDGTTAEGGPVTKLLGTSLTFGNGTSGTDITVTFDGESNDGVLKWMEDEDYFEFSDDLLIAAAEKIQFRDTGLYINSSNDRQLDIVADTEVQIAATTVDINGAVDISGNLGVGGNLTVTGTTTFNGGTITMGDAASDNVVFGADVNSSIIPNTDSTFDLGSSGQEWRDLFVDGTAHLDAINFNGTVITSTAAELNILDGVTATATELNLIDGVTATTAELNILDGVTSTAAELNLLDGVTSTTAELNILDGVTSTAAELNILDVSNSTVGDLAEISTAANDDVIIALDTSGGGIKKITRSTFLAGSGSSADIANVVEDTSPQLGGNLDMNGADIVTTSNATIDLAPNGTGTVVVRGNTNSGAIVFNCESNTHGQKVIAQPHSASVTNTMLLPAGANSTLVSLVSTDTLTNKTLTSPKINEDVAVTSTAAEINLLDGVTSTTAELNSLDGVTSTAAELNALDGITAVVGELNALDLGSTAVGTAIASKAVILDSNKDYTGIRNLTISGELDAATLDISGAIDVAGNSVLASVDVTGVATAATFEPDGDTAAGDNAAIGYTAAEGLILTGQGSTSDITLKNDADAVVFTVPTGTDDILFPDNAKILMGAGADLQLHHDGSHSYVDDTATGNLYLRSNGAGVIVETVAGVTMARFLNGNACDFNFGSTTRLATTSTGIEVTGIATVGGAQVKVAGKETIWVPASAMQPTTSNGCSALTTVETTSGRPDLVVLDFDKDSDEFAQFSVAFPVSWNAGTVTFQVFWAGIAATTDVDWMVDAVAISNNTTIDVAYGTAVVVTDNAQGAVEELNVSAESGAVTIAGSPGDDELCFFRIGRDVSGDGMAGDARLVGIKLFFTTDLANDG